MSPSSTSSSERLKLVGPDDSILVPEDLVGGRRVLAIGVLALFAVVCVGTLLVDVIWPAARPVAIGAEGAREAKLALSAKWYDGTLAAKTERDLRMTSRVRRTFGSPYALALYELCGFAHGEVTAGKDGWLFYTGRSTERLNTTYVEKQVVTSAAELAAIDRRLRAIGVRALVMPIPRKERIMTSKLPSGADARPWIEDRLLEALRRRRVLTTDLVSAWAAAGTADESYHTVGSHWTTDAELWSAETAAHELGKWTPPDERRSTLKVSKTAPADCDLLVLAGVDLEVAKSVVKERKYNLYSLARTSADPMPADDVDTADIVVVGTSFTAERVFPKLLGYFCDEPVGRQSEPGGETSLSFLKLVRRRASRLPGTIVFELPPHLLFADALFTGFDAAYGLLPLPDTERVLDIPVRPEVSAKLARLGRNAVPLGALPPGALTHDGAGIAQVRLRGRPGANGVLIGVRTGSVNRNYAWPATTTELLVPILAVGDESPLVHVVASSSNVESSLELESIEVVTIGRPLAKDDSTRPAKQVGDGWSAVLLDGFTPPAGDHAKLVLQLVQPSAEAGVIETSLRALRGDELVWSRSLELRAGASTSLIDLDPLESLEGLRFELASPRHRFVVQLAELVDGGAR